MDQPPRSLSALREAERACRRCPLYRHATQAVPGEGPRRARLMLVGEQPGNDEDLAGAPFIGPAGRVLDLALEAAGLDRATIFVTNAVKHFKFVPRGKRRLHQRPNAGEIDACRVWNRAERALVKPALVVALGATALRSLTGKTLSISSMRGRTADLDGGAKLIATIHPSFLLRIRDADDKRKEQARFVADLKRARDFLG
jgi:uracil-DNA glycosylase